MTVGGVEQRTSLTPTEWVLGELKSGPNAGPVALSGGWTAADTFALDLVRYRTPFTARYTIRFSGDEVTVETRPNVGATPPKLTGKRG